MPRIIVKGATANGTASSAGSNHSNATCVRVYNSSGADVTVSVEDSSESLLGSFILKAGATEIVEKGATDQIFGSTALKITPIAING